MENMKSYSERTLAFVVLTLTLCLARIAALPLDGTQYDFVDYLSYFW